MLVVLVVMQNNSQDTSMDEGNEDTILSDFIPSLCRPWYRRVELNKKYLTGTMTRFFEPFMHFANDREAPFKKIPYRVQIFQWDRKFINSLLINFSTRTCRVIQREILAPFEPFAT